MEFLSKLEHLIQKWLKDAPHLPEGARRWVGENIWWVTAVCAVGTAVGTLGLLIALFGNLSTLGSPFASYYASETIIVWTVVKIAVRLAFTAIVGLLLALAILPLREKQKNGWTLLFAAWVVSGLGVVVSAVLTLSTLSFLTDVIFGALWLGVWAYFIFEVRNQFAHVERSKGIKAKKAKRVEQ